MFKKKEYIEVDSFALDEFIAKEYGLDNFEGTLESPNDSEHAYTIDGKLEEWEEDDLKEILKRKNCEHYCLSTVLNDLCRKGRIEAGNYLVEVCW